MAFNKEEILNAVVTVAKAAEAKNGSKKKADRSQEIITRTAEYLSSITEITDRTELDLSAAVCYCIYSELCAYKQYRSLSEALWPEVVEKTALKLRKELSRDRLALLYSTPQTVSERLKAVFTDEKEKDMPKAVLSELSECENKKRRESINTPTSEFDSIAENAYRKFMLTYDPYGDVPVNVAYMQFFKNEENSYYSRSEKKKAPLSLNNALTVDDGELELGEMIANENAVSPEESLICSFEVIRKCDVMRDLLIVPKKLGISRIQLGYYRCFYTDNVSYMIEEVDAAYEHVKKNLKVYSGENGIDVDFLNFFVDAKCRTVLDAYRKPRKLMSTFKEKCDPKARCTQPLELVVFGKYLGKKESSVSEFRDKYKVLVSSSINNTED